MNGRRIPLEVWDDAAQPQLNGRPKLPRTSTFEPGDYCGPIVGYNGDRPAMFFMLPVAEGHPDHGLRHVTSPPHDAFVEHDDGTVTISPSILAVRSESEPTDPPPWHGYLERGIWREV